MKIISAVVFGAAEIIVLLSVLVLLLADKVSPESAVEIRLIAALALLIFGGIRYL